MQTKEVSLNHEQSLYVIPCGDGYTCLGFDVCRIWTERYAKFAVVSLPSPLPFGSLEAYQLYVETMDQARTFAATLGKRCPIHLTAQLNGLEGKRVEVVDVYGERRRFIVGKSTGWAPCHLEISTRRSSGGPSVSGAPFQSVHVVA